MGSRTTVVGSSRSSPSSEGSDRMVDAGALEWELDSACGAEGGTWRRAALSDRLDVRGFLERLCSASESSLRLEPAAEGEVWREAGGEGSCGGNGLPRGPSIWGSKEKRVSGGGSECGEKGVVGTYLEGFEEVLARVSTVGGNGG